MQYGHCEGDLTGITFNIRLYSAIGSQLAFLQTTDPCIVCLPETPREPLAKNRVPASTSAITAHWAIFARRPAIS